jgi:hypothetical protein
MFTVWTVHASLPATPLAPLILLPFTSNGRGTHGFVPTTVAPSWETRYRCTGFTFWSGNNTKTEQGPACSLRAFLNIIFSACDIHIAYTGQVRFSKMILNWYGRNVYCTYVICDFKKNLGISQKLSPSDGRKWNETDQVIWDLKFSRR